MQFEIAIRASLGARRAQEDAALWWPPGAGDAPGRVAAVLCDGMGGHIGGATASKTASEAFLPSLVCGDDTVRDRLMFALDRANVALADQISRNPTLNGMGSTLIGIEADAAGLHWISVGDSLLYLWRSGEIVALNADHSLAPEIDKLAAAGKISWAQARSDPRRHYLRSALTGDEIEMIDLAERPAHLTTGDVIVLASDGVNTLETATIAELIGSRATHSAVAIAEKLLACVEGAGEPHQDNTTVVAIRVLA